MDSAPVARRVLAFFGVLVVIAAAVAIFYLHLTASRPGHYSDGELVFDYPPDWQIVTRFGLLPTTDIDRVANLLIGDARTSACRNADEVGIPVAEWGRAGVDPMAPCWPQSLAADSAFIVVEWAGPEGARAPSATWPPPPDPASSPVVISGHPGSVALRHRSDPLRSTDEVVWSVQPQPGSDILVIDATIRPDSAGRLRAQIDEMVRSIRTGGHDLRTTPPSSEPWPNVAPPSGGPATFVAPGSSVLAVGTGR